MKIERFGNRVVFVVVIAGVVFRVGRVVFGEVGGLGDSVGFSCVKCFEFL